MTTKRAFTLLEISVSLILVALIASVVGWQMTTLIGSHRFRASSETLINEIKQLQALALSYHADMELKIFTSSKGEICYKTSTDEIKMLGRRREGHLKGVESLRLGKEKIKSADFTIFSTGRIDPPQKLVLCAKEGTKTSIDLSSLQINVKREYKDSQNETDEPSI